MERLTIPDRKIDGGVRRAFIDVKAVKENAMTIYWALKKYEDTGLTPEQVMELKERDTAKKMLPLTYKPLLEAGWRYECPNCGCAVGENIYHPDVTKDYEYCSMCGQKLEG